MLTYEQIFPPPAASQPSTPLPSKPFIPLPEPQRTPTASSTSAPGLKPSLPSPSASITAAASGADDSHPPPYTPAGESASTPRAGRPSPLVLGTPVISRRLSSQPATPSPLGRYPPTPLFLGDEKDDEDEFGVPNPELLGPAGCTPPSSPMEDPRTPRLPTNPFRMNAYGVGSSSPSYALKQLPDLSGVMSQRLSSPASSASASAAASSAPRPPLVEASAKDRTVTVRLLDSGAAHVSGEEVSISDDGISASASGPASRAVAVMPNARVAALAFVDQGVAHAKVAREAIVKVPSSSSTVIDKEPVSPPVTRLITGRRAGKQKATPAPPSTSDWTAPSAERLAACLHPVSANDVADAGVVEARLDSTSLKSVSRTVIAALPGYGQSMLNILRIATDLELADSATRGTLTSSGRPAAIGLFKQNHYKFRAGVMKSIDAAYPEKMWSWWSRLIATQRPSVSVSRGSSTVTRPRSSRPGTQWTSLQLTGNCGLFDIVIGLLLWRMHIDSRASASAVDEDLNAWAELVVDVEDVFSEMDVPAAAAASQTATAGKRKTRNATSSRKRIRRGS
jgi:hypothetical protein